MGARQDAQPTVHAPLLIGSAKYVLEIIFYRLQGMKRSGGKFAGIVLLSVVLV